MAKPTTTMYFGLQGNINSKQITKRFTAQDIEDFKNFGICSDIGLYILGSLVVKYGNKEYITINKKHTAKGKNGKNFDRTLDIKIKTASGKDSENLRTYGLDKEFLKDLIAFLNESCVYIAEGL